MSFFVKCTEGHIGGSEVVLYYFSVLHAYWVSLGLSCLGQGQARRYGRITHFLPLPLRGHHFQRATVTQWLDRFQIPGYQMKDMHIVFPLIPNSLL